MELPPKTNEEIATEVSNRYLELIVVKKTTNPVTHTWVKEEVLEALTEKDKQREEAVAEARREEPRKICINCFAKNNKVIEAIKILESV